MGELFGAGPEIPYKDRSTRLEECGVAVWDVLRASVRPGSLDADIQLASAKANDFRSFFSTHCNLQLVCFNGRKAAELFERLVRPDSGGTIDDVRCLTLPSTSPAHAAMNFEQKLRRWSVVRI